MVVQRTTTADGHVQIKGIRRGMVFWADVPPPATQGREQHNEPGKPRPWIIVSSDKLHQRRTNVLAVPVTTREIDSFPGGNVFLDVSDATPLATDAPRFEGKGTALTEQLRVLAHSRLKGPPAAVITRMKMAEIDAGLLYVLGIELR